MTINANGKPQNVVRSMQQYDLSDYIDEVTATTNADAPYAEAGDDKIYGDAGDDYINGGAGMDTFLRRRRQRPPGRRHRRRLPVQGDADNDVLEGGAGLDTCAAAMATTSTSSGDNDTITEYSGQGTDTVVSALKTYTPWAPTSRTRSPTPARGRDELRLHRQRADNRITGGCSTATTLCGGAAGNIAGRWRRRRQPFGGTGNDRYYADDANDEVFEKAGEGTDTVYATVPRQLEFQVENPRSRSAPARTGPPATSAMAMTWATPRRGANGDDKPVRHSAGSDHPNGGAGNNTLYGGARAMTSTTPLAGQ